MREIDLGAKLDMSRLPTQTILGYGDTRSGKTTWAAGMPRPLFLADATEQGWDSIANLPDDLLFEPGVIPIVWALENQGDLEIAMTRIDPLLQSGRVLSIVTDSISFYADMAFNTILNAQTKADTRAAYGTLGNHLRHVRVRVHGKKRSDGQAVSTYWAALAKHPSEESPGGGPLIPGAQATKFSAGVEYLLFHRKKPGTTPAAAPEFMIHTKPHMSYIAGNRLGERAHLLPDPFTGSYSDFLATLGYDLDAVRASMPKIKPATTSVTAPAAVKPPIAVAKPAVIVRPATPTNNAARAHLAPKT